MLASRSFSVGWIECLPAVAFAKVGESARMMEWKIDKMFASRSFRAF